MESLPRVPSEMAAAGIGVVLQPVQPDGKVTQPPWRRSLSHRVVHEKQARRQLPGVTAARATRRARAQRAVYRAPWMTRASGA